MIEKIENRDPVTRPDLFVVEAQPQPVADIPLGNEEDRVRETLQSATAVLNDIAESIVQNDQANSPDADRSHGRVEPEVFDLLSS